MVQQSAKQRVQQRQFEHLQPKKTEIFLHGFKTVKLMGALLKDRRVPVVHKGVFVGSVVGLLVLLFFPDIMGEAILSAVLPVIGTVLGVPLDAGVDWIAFALLVMNMLKFFPQEHVAEHYNRIFHDRELY